LGTYKYGDREFWGYDEVALSGGTIYSGLYSIIVLSGEDLVEPAMQITGGEISSGIYTEIVLHDSETLVEPAVALTGGTIAQGKTWNPIVEGEPPWD
jgi:hypothetical protein